MFLEGIIQQSRVRRLIESMVTGNRLPHALLFWGAQGVGKSAAAIELAKWLNCTNSESAPCGECSSCQLFTNLQHPHFSYQIPLPGKALVDSENGELTQTSAEQLSELLSFKGQNPYYSMNFPGGQFILIGQIRSLLRWANMRPFNDKPRIALIDHADRLREEAANALLKLLEEPPPDFILILTAENPEDILPTLRSRCFLMEFDRLNNETIAAELKKRGFTDDHEVARIARLTAGNLSRALDFAQHPDRIAASFELAINIVRYSLGKNPLEFNPLLENWSGKSLSEQQLILEIISSWLRDAALMQYQREKSDPHLIHSDHADLLTKFTDNCPQADFLTAYREVDEARWKLENNTLAPLVLITLARRLFEAIYQRKPV